MAQFPSLPLWTDSYLADTRHLSAQEHGAYLLLLITAWRTQDCCLPNDDKLLARYASVSPRIWKKLRLNVMGFFTIDEETNTFYQKRLSKERKYVTEKSNTQRNNVNARWLKTKETTDTTVIPTAYQTDTPTPTPTPTPIGKKAAPKNGARISPDWKPSEANKEYAISKGFHNGQIQTLADKFLNYWLGATGKNAIKLDWDATWRNKVINEAERIAPKQDEIGERIR